MADDNTDSQHSPAHVGFDESKFLAQVLEFFEPYMQKTSNPKRFMKIHNDMQTYCEYIRSGLKQEQFSVSKGKSTSWLRNQIITKYDLPALPKELAKKAAKKVRKNVIIEKIRDEAKAGSYSAKLLLQALDEAKRMPQ